MELKHHLKPQFIGGMPNSIVILILCRMNLVVQNRFLVPANIDAVRELIMQDHHVTYHEIKASLCISSNSIHKVLYENLAMKKIF